MENLASAKWTESTAGSAPSARSLRRRRLPPNRNRHRSGFVRVDAPGLGRRGDLRVHPARATGASGPGSCVGFLFAVGNASFATRFPAVDDAAREGSAGDGGVRRSARALFLTSKDEEWASALRAPPADTSTTCPVILEVVSMRVRERRPIDGTSFVVDIPLVRLAATPGWWRAPPRRRLGSRRRRRRRRRTRSRMQNATTQTPRSFRFLILGSARRSRVASGPFFGVEKWRVR